MGTSHVLYTLMSTRKVEGEHGIEITRLFLPLRLAGDCVTERKGLRERERERERIAAAAALCGRCSCRLRLKHANTQNTTESRTDQQLQSFQPYIDFF